MCYNTYIINVNIKDSYSKNSWKWLLIILPKNESCFCSATFKMWLWMIICSDLERIIKCGVFAQWSGPRTYNLMTMVQIHYIPPLKYWKMSHKLFPLIWRYGRIGRVTTLSPWSFRVQSPVASPDSNSWFCQNIEALILNSLLRGTTTVITITNIRLFNTLA